jgi:hypothetical protein
MHRASAFYLSTNKKDYTTGGIFPYSASSNLPTRTMKKPEKIFKVIKKGKLYKVMGENGLTWDCPEWLYNKLEMEDQQPAPGRRVMLTYNLDNTVKNYQVFK